MSTPKKVYVETTTRCNLLCNKCIKQVENHGIVEGDMPFKVFERIASELSAVEQLILNGIGEPLLHPDLEKMIKVARKTMPRKAVIGFQTNGLLMSAEKARRLVSAGLSTVCLSLDNLHNEEKLDLCHRSPSLLDTSKALNNLQSAAQALNNGFRLGLEIVISKNNIHELPEMVKWAAGHDVDYILVSHLFAYDQEMVAESLFSTNTLDALSLFQQWQQSAQKQGVNLQEGMKAYLKFSKSVSEKSAIHLLKEMSKEAAKRGVTLHWDNLFTHNAVMMESTRRVFSQSQLQAEKHKITLFLPPLHAQSQPSCPFIEEDAAFISFLGNISPCHFLWHTYPCMSGNDIINVEEKSFGNIKETTLQGSWLSREYVQFRAEAAQKDFSPCWSCVLGPCEDLITTNLFDANDCYGSKVPCGHCRWSIGGLKCL